MPAPADSVTAARPGPLDVTALREAVAAQHVTFLALLEDFVNRDSGSLDPHLVTAFGRHVGELLEARGWSVELLDLPAVRGGRQVGSMLDARLPGGRADDPTAPVVLLMAHLDTVFSEGEAARRPFHVDEAGMARGPGVTDDKAGIVSAIVVADVLRQLGLDRWRELRLVCTPDEELGSPASRPVLGRLARDVDVALCLEAARANGDIVSARKGIADVLVTVHGRAAHAGVEPEKGIHALLQAARTTVALQELNGRWDGVTVNVGTLQAGTRPNVIPAEAVLEVDLRAWDRLSHQQALAAIVAEARRVHVDGVTIDVEVLEEAPPMVRTPATAALAAMVAADAEQLGFTVRDARTGGAADANTTASVGVPTLDGLAPVGGDDHAPSEWLDTATITDRVTLLASLVARLSAEGVPG